MAYLQKIVPANLPTMYYICLHRIADAATKKDQITPAKNPRGNLRFSPHRVRRVSHSPRSTKQHNMRYLHEAHPPPAPSPRCYYARTQGGDDKS